MDAQEINRKISELKEPMPGTDWWLSPLRAWRERGDMDWQPRNWTGDPAANEELLEEMPKANAYVWVEWDINEWCVMWKATT